MVLGKEGVTPSLKLRRRSNSQFEDLGEIGMSHCIHLASLDTNAIPSATRSILQSRKLFHKMRLNLRAPSSTTPFSWEREFLRKNSRLRKILAKRDQINPPYLGILDTSRRIRGKLAPLTPFEMLNFTIKSEI